jgi:hypothetical protein
MGDPISLVLDCADPLRVGAFWRQALGTAPQPGPDDWFVVLQDPEGNEFCLV